MFPSCEDWSKIASFTNREFYQFMTPAQLCGSSSSSSSSGTMGPAPIGVHCFCDLGPKYFGMQQKCHPQQHRYCAAHKPLGTKPLCASRRNEFGQPNIKRPTFSAPSLSYFAQFVTSCRCKLLQVARSSIYQFICGRTNEISSPPRRTEGRRLESGARSRVELCQGS